jgi:hypothetical protein
MLSNCEKIQYYTPHYCLNRSCIMCPYLPFNREKKFFDKVWDYIKRLFVRKDTM